MKMAAPVLRRGLTVALDVLFGAMLWIVILIGGGSALLLFGVASLYGFAWAAIVGAMICFAFAVIVVLGVRNAQ